MNNQKYFHFQSFNNFLDIHKKKIDFQNFQNFIYSFRNIKNPLKINENLFKKKKTFSISF
jgi:hypothetical protein